MNDIIFNNDFDCIWIASDKDGYVAAFFTAGQGPIPQLVAKNEKIALDNIEDEVYKLPVRSDVNLYAAVKRPDDFIEMSKRGFFVYDWRDIARAINQSSNQYELVSSPHFPILVRDLPEPIKDVAIGMMFSRISFKESLKIDLVNNNHFGMSN